ncbi:MAG: HXXEE domain-containing protein [Candidatus Eisenbacteria bacterium]|nr:HXXEE domain-containing protein [Candidatus Eisenbacteria bacterium]
MEDRNERAGGTGPDRTREYDSCQSGCAHGIREVGSDQPGDVEKSQTRPEAVQPGGARSGPAGTDPRLDPRRNLGMPWLFLCLALAIHVAEEIGSGFLSAYDLALEAMRRLVPYVEVPHVSLTVWLGGSIGVVAVLALLTPLAYRGARGMRVLMLWVIGLALANVAGHLGGSILAGRMIPGAYSTIALAVACAYAIMADRRRVSALRDAGRRQASG